jgi:hypothetical protein
MRTIIAVVAIGAFVTTFHPGLAHGLHVHGRAGHLVGSERVQRISNCIGQAGFWRQLAFAPRPGRAGGPVGWIDASSSSVGERTLLLQRYGRIAEAVDAP